MKIIRFKTNKKVINQSGFSLIELILYLGILSILIVALFQLLTSIFDIQLESQSTSSVSQDGGFILNRFEYDVGRAESVSFPLLGDQGQSLDIFDGQNTYTYSLIGDNLIISATPSGTSEQLNSFNTKVTDVTFQTLSDSAQDLRTVTLTFTLESLVRRRGGTETDTFRTTVGTR